MLRATLVFSALALLRTLIFNPTTVNASTLNCRDPIVPFLDYEGIAITAQGALLEDTSTRHGASSLSRTCTVVRKRREWRQLTKAQKKDYIRAIKCLQTKWDYGISPISNTFVASFPVLFDALTQVHQMNWTDFHHNACFLPWHRWPTSRYWNYTMDYKDPFASPIFATDETGFGTHGRQKLNVSELVGFKVDNGPFANFKVNLPVPHYLMRNFSAWKDVDKAGEWDYALGEAFSPKQLKTALAANKFSNLEETVDGFSQLNNLGLHNGPHFFNFGDWTGPA
ncbi:hypothetical protein FRC17_009375 [Serendipita sp. 399]|nr:hypothetical protein FRC17_009375 [Serendipita sp. 399]